MSLAQLSPSLSRVIFAIQGLDWRFLLNWSWDLHWTACSWITYHRCPSSCLTQQWQAKGCHQEWPTPPWGVFMRRYGGATLGQPGGSQTSLHQFIYFWIELNNYFLRPGYNEEDARKEETGNSEKNAGSIKGNKKRTQENWNAKEQQEVGKTVTNEEGKGTQ